MEEPKFYQAILKPIKGNVLDHVYPDLKGDKQLTMVERMGSDLAHCPECIEQRIEKEFNRWSLLADEHVAVVQGGKPYIECLDCGYVTHL